LGIRASVSREKNRFFTLKNRFFLEFNSGRKGFFTKNEAFGAWRSTSSLAKKVGPVATDSGTQGRNNEEGKQKKSSKIEIEMEENYKKKYKILRKTNKATKPA